VVRQSRPSSDAIATFYEIEAHAYRATQKTTMSATFSFQIFVRTLSGNTITLDVQPTDTIATVKANVLRKDRPGTPTEPQAVRLAFGSKQLHDTRSLGEYGIDRDCTLDVSGRLLGGMRLYHCTSKSNAAAIKRNGFRCGSSGLAGGGIYFAESVDDASRKARHQGVVLECEVNLGRMRHIGFSGEDDLTLSRLNSAGYDSVCIPRNGTEYCVYESSRVRVVGEHRDTRASSPVSSPRRSHSIRSILHDSDDDDDMSRLQAHMLMRALHARQFQGGWGGPGFIGFGGPGFGFGGFGGGGFFLG
jgi:ubiquitin C